MTLGLPTGRELTSPSAELLSALRRRRSLLIFDDPENLPDWITSLSGGPDILLTSRLRGWGRDVIEHDLALLSTSEAVGLLRETAPAVSDGDAEAIVSLVGGLPLALALMASALSSGTPVGTIIQSLNSPGEPPRIHPRVVLDAGTGSIEGRVGGGDRTSAHRRLLRARSRSVQPPYQDACHRR